MTQRRHRQVASMRTWPTQAKAALETENVAEAFADRGYFKGEEILACEEAGHHGHAAKNPRLRRRSPEGRFGKQVIFPLCCRRGHLATFVQPVRSLIHRFANEENGLVLHRYCIEQRVPRPARLKAQCTKGPQRRITRWEARARCRCRAGARIWTRIRMRDAYSPRDSRSIRSAR